MKIIVVSICLCKFVVPLSLLIHFSPLTARLCLLYLLHFPLLFDSSLYTYPPLFSFFHLTSIMKLNQWSLAVLWIVAVALLVPPPTGGTDGGGDGGYGYYPPGSIYPSPPEFGPGYSTNPPIVDPTPNPPPPSVTYSYHYSPPTTLDPTLSPPSSQSGGGYSYPPPYSDTFPTPSIDPGVSIPSPPFVFDPNSPPFTCIIWGSRPTLIWGLLGYWGTVGNLFGAPSSTYPAGDGGSNMSLQEALLNTRSDPIGALYREGTASLLNSMATTKFPYSTHQVRDRFVSALSSNKAAASQAQLFKLANEGHLLN